VSDQPWLDVEDEEFHYCPTCDAVTQWFWNVDELVCTHESPGEVPARRVVDTNDEGKVICVYVGDTQIAGAVRLDLSDDAVRDLYGGLRYHVWSSLPGGLPVAYVKDRAAAVAWLGFLADLYEGRWLP